MRLTAPPRNRSFLCEKLRLWAFFSHSAGVFQSGDEGGVKVKRLITALDLRGMIGHGEKTLVVPKDSIFSPSAQDLAKELSLEICRQGSVTHVMQHPEAAQPPLAAEAKSADAECQTGAVGGAKETDIRALVSKVLTECLKPACAEPKVTHVKGQEVIIPAFDQAPPGQKIGMVDVVTSREGNLGAGFMTYERSKLPWHLTYDEVDYVVEGEFHLEVNHQLIKGGPGDVIYIPKGSHVIFGSPSYTKVFYVTYPSNWAELSGNQ